MEISNYARPQSLDEAWTLLTEQKGFPIGGGAWSRLNSRNIDLAVDLSALDLRFIRKQGSQIEIGAMTTARDIELSEELEANFGGLFQKAVKHIVGVQMRNIVTVGGTVAGRYGFSDLNTTLLALNAKVVLYNQGTVDFESFLSNRSSDPILIEKIVIDTDQISGSYQSVRNTVNDFAILNVAAALVNGEWRIAIGARPGTARLAAEAAKTLGETKSPDQESLQKAAEAAAEEIAFGSDIRGTAEYRRSVCKALVKRAIQEVAE